MKDFFAAPASGLPFLPTAFSAHAEGADEYARRREAFVHLALLGLRRAELASASGNDALEIRVQLARLAEDRLGDPIDAIERWQQLLGERLLVVPYAELVDDPALWTAKLLSHCGLADEPGVHRPHETQRVVMTASAMQVRRPINREGLGVAAPYRAHLQPFVDAYNAAEVAA